MLIKRPVRSLPRLDRPRKGGTAAKAAKEHKGEVPTLGSGNYASEEEKEIARLQRELRDTKDALEVLKKAIGILGN